MVVYHGKKLEHKITFNKFRGEQVTLDIQTPAEVWYLDPEIIPETPNLRRQTWMSRVSEQVSNQPQYPDFLFDTSCHRLPCEMIRLCQFIDRGIVDVQLSWKQMT